MLQDINRYFKEAINEFEQIETILLNKDNRDLSEVQIGIMVRKRFSAFTSFKDSALEGYIPTETKIDFYQTLLPRIRTILSSKPADNRDLYWYQLASLQYDFITNVITFWKNTGLLRTNDAANAIFDLLSSLEIVESNDILVESTHPEFFLRNSLAIELNNSYIEAHYFAATNLSSISRKNLEDLSLKGLAGNQKLLEIINRIWDISLYLSLDSELGENHTYNLCNSVIDIFNSMLRNLIPLIGRFGSTWPETDTQIEFLYPENYISLIKSLELIIDKRNQYIDDLQKHIEDGTFDSNNPTNSKDIQLTLIFSDLYNYIIKGLQLSFEIIQNEQQELFFELKQNVEDFVTYINSNQDIILIPNLINSHFAERLVSVLKLFIYQLAVYCYNNRSIKEFDDFEQTFNLLFTEEAVARIPQLHSLYLAAKLFVSIELDDKNLTYEIANKLEKIAPQNLFQSQSAISLLLLAELTKLSMNKIQLKTFTNKMKKQIDYAKRFMGDGYIQLVTGYVEAIQDTINTGNPITIDRIIEFNPFDPYTFLIPDLELFFERSNLQNIKYIPYNLSIDSVIDE